MGQGIRRGHEYRLGRKITHAHSKTPEMNETNATQHRANLKRFAKIKKALDARDAIVDTRFNSQDLTLVEIKTLGIETRDLGRKTNGRVTRLEDVVAPINAAYQKFDKAYTNFKWLAGLVIGSPIVVVIVEHLIKVYWK